MIGNEGPSRHYGVRQIRDSLLWTTDSPGPVVRAKRLLARTWNTIKEQPSWLLAALLITAPIVAIASALNPEFILLYSVVGVSAVLATFIEEPVPEAALWSAVGYTFSLTAAVFTGTAAVVPNADLLTNGVRVVTSAVFIFGFFASLFFKQLGLPSIRVFPEFVFPVSGALGLAAGALALLEPRPYKEAATLTTEVTFGVFLAFACYFAALWSGTSLGKLRHRSAPRVTPETAIHSEDSS